MPAPNDQVTYTTKLPIPTPTPNQNDIDQPQKFAEDEFVKKEDYAKKILTAKQLQARELQIQAIYQGIRKFFLEEPSFKDHDVAEKDNQQALVFKREQPEPKSEIKFEADENGNLSIRGYPPEDVDKAAALYLKNNPAIKLELHVSSKEDAIAHLKRFAAAGGPLDQIKGIKINGKSVTADELKKIKEEIQTKPEYDRKESLR